MKFPSPVKLPSGRYRIQIMVNGHRVSQTFDSEREAVYWAAGLKTKEREISLAPQSMTLSDAIERYIDSRRSVLSPATIRGYKGIQTCQLGRLEHTQLNKLTQESIQRWVSDLARNHAPKTVANAHGLVSAVLREYRPNMVLHTKLPQKKKQEIVIPTEAEIQAIVRGARGRKYELPILLAIYMGLRESEITGLRWDHIQGDTMLIDTAIVRGEEGPCEKGTKSTSGTRRLHIPKAVAELLDLTPHRGDHVVTIAGHAIYNGLQRICEREGIPRYRFHDLRHVNASAMLAEGIPDSYGRDRMGHSTTHMLKRVYQHTFRDKEDEYDRQIEESIDRILVGKPAKES